MERLDSEMPMRSEAYDETGLRNANERSETEEKPKEIIRGFRRN